MGIIKIKQNSPKMSYKENTRRNNNRLNLKEKTEKEYRIEKRQKQSDEAFDAMQTQLEEDHDRSMSKKKLGKKARNNGKLNKAQRNYDKVEEVIDVEKMNVAVKKQKQRFFMGR